MHFIWKKWVKPAFIIIYVVGLCVGLPFIILNLRNEPTQSMIFAWFVGGFFVLGAIPISLWTILEHLINYTKPYLQRNIIRILWMVPIYATNAWFALRFPHTAIYFDTLRECYEAYAIYNFLAFLLNYLRREYPELNQHLEQKQQVKHIPPLCCCRPWPMGSQFIEHCRHGVLQYTVIRPITTIIALICEVCGVYGETNFSYKYAYVYLTVINNISQVVRKVNPFLFILERTEL
uniref:Transmembrane protein 184C n=2 Tax=Schistocephalus solidus TaxID=70667 RepID=A0A0X3NJU8_SCHSO